MFLVKPAQARGIENAAESPGIKRDAACRHCSKDAASAEGWDAVLKWPAEFAEVADGIP